MKAKSNKVKIESVRWELTPIYNEKYIDEDELKLLSEIDDEDELLENNSYWDIDILEKHNAPIREEIRYWAEEFKPVNNMGKWYQQVRIESLMKKLKHYED